MRQVVLDTETTGLEPGEGHRIIEVGAVELIDRRKSGRNFHSYINPHREIEDGALEVHGITREFLLDKPSFSDIAEDLMSFVSGAELIIHNAAFDEAFINMELSLLESPHGRLTDFASILDSLELARSLHPGQRNNLDALCKRYEIDNSTRILHGALRDAEILAEVYLAMTGGQSDLGLTFTASGERELSDISGGARQRLPFRVLRATPIELAAHHARLEAIAKESGSCLWLELERSDSLLDDGGESPAAQSRS